MHKVKVAINRGWKGKAIPFDDNIPDDHPDWERQGNISRSWFNVQIDLQELFAEIQQGHAVNAHLLTKDGEYVLNEHVGYRVNKDFVVSDVVLVDIDHGMTLDEALSHPFYQSYGTGAYTTSSHTSESHRFRLVFRTEDEIDNGRYMRLIRAGLNDIFGGDQKTVDAARAFFGNVGCWYELNEERFIPSKELLRLKKTGKNIIREESERKEVKNRELKKQRYTASGMHYLDPDKPLYRNSGTPLYLHEIKGHMTGIYCPFHEPEQQGKGSEFVDVNAQGIPYLVCQKCAPVIGSSVWPRLDTTDVRFIRKLKNKGDLFTEVDIYTRRYIQPIPQQDGVTLIRSPKATGKTYQLQHVVAEYKAQRKSVLLIGHRVQLLKSMAKKLELEFYKEQTHGGSISPAHYAICINSLPRISALQKPYDVVILDESEQVLQHLVGGTLSKEKRKHIVNLFYKHIQDAKAVYCLDADLGELTAEAIRDLRGADDSYYAVLNEYTAGGSIKLYESRKNIISAAHEAIRATGPVIVISNSKKHHEAIRTTYPVFITSNSKKYIDELSVQLKQDEISFFKITSENSETSEVEHFIDDIDKNIKNYRVILATPAIGTGVDIQARFAHVFGIFEANVNTHYDFDQQLWRVRNPDEVSVYIAPQTFQQPTEQDTIKQSMLDNYERTNDRLGYIDHGEGKPEWYGRLLNMYCHVQALQNISKNHLRDNFVSLKQSHGCQIEWIEKYEEDQEDNDYSEIWEMEKEERRQLLLEAHPCEYSWYTLMKNRRDKTKEQKAQCLRYEIENVFKESLDDNPDLIEYQEQEINWDLLKYEKFTMPIEDLVQRDIEQREEENHIIDLDNYTQRVELITEGLNKAGFIKGGLQWNLLDEVCKEDMTEFIEWARRNESDLQEVLNILVGRVTTEPVRTVKSLLKETGMVAVVSNRERVDGMTKTYYQLSEDRYDLLEKYRLRRQLWWDNKRKEEEEEVKYLESARLSSLEPECELTP